MCVVSKLLFDRQVANNKVNRVRRTWMSYMTYLLLFLTCLGNLYLTQALSKKYYWIFIGLAVLPVLIRLILKPNYFEIKGTRLIINRDLFYTDSIELEYIEKIELEEGPFSKSHIRLKDHRMGLEFNYFIVNDKDFNELKTALKLTVE